LKLHTETTGTGPELVLIHGWGLHGGIWEPLLPLLAPHFRVTVVDLPGHGNSEWQDSEGLPAFADAVLASVPQQAAWLGWSLGGLACQCAAAAGIDAQFRAPVRLAVRHAAGAAGNLCQ
jgi:pimeloyl-[acyl-carrier protein] methyl ester esterase